MHQKFGEKIKREIRRRAFERSDRLRQESQNLQSVKHTLEALHEVTGLPRAQLNAIANETRLSFEVHSEQFFRSKIRF